MRSILLALCLVVLVQNVCGEISHNCLTSGKSMSYLDVATDMIAKAKVFYPSCPTISDSKPKDCADVFHVGHNTSGVYTIWPVNRLLEDTSIRVFCDMDTEEGGWTVIQRRGNFSRPKDYFYQDWDSYKRGFGDIQKDFWLGNNNIYALTNQRLYSIRFDLKDVEGNKAYALYDSFWIADEDNKYRLHIQDYSGNAGDSMIVQHHNHFFSTKDREHDNQKEQNCANLYKGGWWYNSCHHSNLNGQYLRGPHESFADGINWLTWKGYKESLDTTEMKIRPKNFGMTSIFETPKH